ncbi:hypothetical protein PIB30_073621 [Stylosanthes scabra]|uniref:Uncharacterized protein n=1 Tax=Stylosanthes scabra TaxID=79078 RepID=A0ABU6UQ25_9FABA|nr:hypothetical protein [Stylosanthes scabra]
MSRIGSAFNERSGGAGKANDTAYGNSGPSGVMIGPRGSTTDGHPVLVPDRSGLATITDRAQSVEEELNGS